MPTVVAACTLLIALSTVIHFEALRLLSEALPRIRIPPRSKLLIVVYAAFVAHALEMTLYGSVLYLLVRFAGVGSLSGGEGGSFAGCLYFSAETYTSLGFGDVLPVGPIRLIAGTEALNGLLLIGWSASYLYLAMERFWREGKSTPGAG